MSMKPGEVEKLIGSTKLPKISVTKHKLWDDPNTNNLDVPKSDESVILEIDPNDIIKYKYKDRPENELGNLDEFAKNLKAVGQLQPGIVRLSKQSEAKYELIVGERRWRACKLAGLRFKAKLTSYNDTEAGLAQAAENEDRKGLSDYARGISYARQIEDGVLTQSDLAEKLGTTRQQISRLMSYKEIPEELVHAIEDMTKVSPRTAEEIKFICKKDPEALPTLLTLAEKIRNGIGHASLKKNYEKAKSNGADLISNKPVFSDEGRHLFSWRKDGNGELSISFPKDIRNLLDISRAETAFKKSIDEIIKSILSPQGDKKQKGTVMK